ncbi:uncharacterized protein LOC125238463 [Leguminivora glycinivorella]|uniref:uncharacterized protein LOC125238463 n=1 Tax=Leguminivora glycinivorella TaxID=1035111 RepID=UPI0020104320|nr:uncharacterized protein LOC125238463 [Leguminivora glycinivorella]
MGRFPALVLLISVIGTSCGNFPRIKDDSLNEILTVESNFQNDATLNHDRFARHAEIEKAVTESVIRHLMKELHRRYPEAKRQPKSLNKVIKNLKEKLRNHTPAKSQGTQPEKSNGFKGRKEKKGRNTKRLRKLNTNKQVKSVFNKVNKNI